MNATSVQEEQAQQLLELSTYKYLVEGFLMPAFSLFGLLGNSLSVYILRRREVKLKKDFVEILCALATFDNLLLICTFFLFSLPALSTQYKVRTQKNELHFTFNWFNVVRNGVSPFKPRFIFSHKRYLMREREKCKCLFQKLFYEKVKKMQIR